MNLIIDIGNTCVKIDVYDNHERLYHATTHKLTPQKLNTFLSSHDIDGKIKAAIVSSVAKEGHTLLSQFKTIFTVLHFDHHTPIPVKTLYKTPLTLGKDRLAAAIGANGLYPNENVLVIDCGTCIKYDFVSTENVYTGGAIAPGLNMRFSALNTFTQKLPLVSYKQINYITGDTTEKSILSGVINGIIMEINGMINYYKNNYTNLKVILSGGDLKYFDKILKFSIFAVPNIVSLGLNRVLNFNISKQ